jgi:hypothetical protein
VCGELARRPREYEAATLVAEGEQGSARTEVDVADVVQRLAMDLVESIVEDDRELFARECECGGIGLQQRAAARTPPTDGRYGWRVSRRNLAGLLPVAARKLRPNADTDW